jgi:hypothetical protein
VEGTSPVNVIDPVVVAQFVGLFAVPLMFAVGLTTTTVEPGAEGQFPTVAVAITLYVPPSAVVALLIVGF